MKKFILYFLLFNVCCFLFINITPFFVQHCEGNKELTNFDIIIVLGNPATIDCKPAPIMRERVNKGVELFKNKLSNKILFTGSAVGNQCNESDVMYEYAISLGVPNTCIIRDGRAENTYQNAFYAIEQMKKNNYKTAAIVTSQFHIKRACKIFSNYKIEYVMYDCTTPNDISIFKMFIWKQRENLILTYHTIFGYDKDFGLKK